MERRKYITLSTLILALLFVVKNSEAQKDSLKLKQEVEVTKAFQPTVNDAVKINDIPEIKTEQTEAPTFDYSIFSKPVFSTFDVTPITAAKMVGESQPEMQKGLLKLGFGNYVSPYGEFFYNAQPGKKSIFGMHFRSLSSFGDLTLLNGDQVKAPHSDNLAELFGKRFFRKSTLSGSLAFNRKSFNYYGYTGDILTNDLKEQMIPYLGDKQHFSKGTANIRLKSETLSEYDLIYDFGINYHYQVSKTGQSENEAVISADLMKKYDKLFGILKASIIHYTADSIFNRFNQTFGPKQQIWFNINPSVKWVADNASLQLGLNSTMVFDDDTDASLMIWPKIKAEWSPVQEVLTLFAGLDGHLKHNTYSVIAEENPFADPYHDLANTNYKSVISGGLKGKLGPKTNYVAEASYSKVNDQHFFILESQNLYNPLALNRKLNNTFSWLYNDMKMLRLSGEVLHSVSDDLSFHLAGNYYSYQLNSNQKAWQMPNLDVTFSCIFKPTDRLKINTDLFIIGKRTALIRDYELPAPTIQNPNPVSLVNTDTEVNMKTVFDLNVGADYELSNKLNFFGRLNNLAFQKYDQWPGYTSKGFNWMAGFSYSF